MSSELAGFEAEVKDLRKQLEEVETSLQDDPDNASLQELKTSLEEAINLYQASIDELRQAEAPRSATLHTASPAPPPPPPPSAPAEVPKWSRENHPAFQNKKPVRAQSPEEPVVLKTGDTVLAKWISGDKAFHPARITAITGSSSNPLYNVKFKDHGDTESNLRKEAIKPIRNDAKKRKADGPAVSSPAPSSPIVNPGIISAGPDIDLALAQAKKEPSRVSDGPTRPPKVAKTLKGKGALEKGKSNWQDFQNKGKGPKKKESMFRTGDGPNARVGFIGSGQTMRKDGPRTKHIYNKLDDEA